MPSLFDRLKERKLVQWGVAYLGAAWLVLQVAGEAVDTFSLPPILLRAGWVLLGVGFITTLVLAWYHGEKGAQRISAVELLMLGTLLLLAGVGITLVRRDGAPSASSTAEASAVPVAAPAADRRSLAVLPFANLSTSKDDEYFSDGVSEDILMTLGDIGGLRVTSRTSVIQYKGTSKPVGQIASELGVTYVLEGSIQRAGDRVRIRARLIDAGRELRVWGQRYDRPAADILTVQSEIAMEIARALKAELTPVEEVRVGRQPTADLTAYDLVLRGRDHYHRISPRDNEAAIQLFRRAIGIDPKYVDAHIALANAYWMKGQLHGGGVQWEDSAVAVARRAIALDPRSARAYHALGWALDWLDRLDEARAAYLRAVELNPDLTDGLGNLSHSGYGRIDEAVRLYRRALAVNPNDPVLNLLTGRAFASLGMFDRAEGFYSRNVAMGTEHIGGYLGLARLSLLRGRPEEAEAHIRRMFDDLGETPGALGAAGIIAAAAGDLTAARRYYEKRLALDPRAADLQLAWIYQRSGEAERAREIVRRAARLEVGATRLHDKPGDFADLARLQLGEGDREEALRLLEVAVRRGWREYYFTLLDPILSSLRGDPRFDRLMAQVKADVDRQRARVEREGW